MKRTENPAKVFLRRYISIAARIDALKEAIDAAMAMAFGTAVTLKQVKVLSSPAEHDPMAADVCTAVDASEILRETLAKAENDLREILCAIDAVGDERQKAILTYRYVDGKAFPEIAEKMHFSEPAIFVAHGRALVAVNKWMERRADNGKQTIPGYYRGEPEKGRSCVS